ncbi:DUF4357 domain-containing protein [Streptosporangium sp. NPDC006007]|uniref:DUF4357 domain-containing protein n=1 Tax=Streptosporangium sp. NPDC006007 TaxID=3154575 RepID=UPI0033B49947
MAAEYPEFQIRLPNGGPTAHGRLLDERGPNGSLKFLVRSGSPVRQDTVSSFKEKKKSSYEYRQRLIDDGVIVESTSWPGYLEISGDFTFNSPSAAAGVLLGRSTNGSIDWKTPDGRPLADFLTQVRTVSNRTWLVRGSNVSGLDLVQRLWLPEERVSVAAGRLREGVAQGVSKDQLRGFVEEDYESTATYTQKLRLVEEFHTFLSRMKPGDTVCCVPPANGSADCPAAFQVASPATYAAGCCDCASGWPTSP